MKVIVNSDKLSELDIESTSLELLNINSLDGKLNFVFRDKTISINCTVFIKNCILDPELDRVRRAVEICKVIHLQPVTLSFDLFLQLNGILL